MGERKKKHLKKHPQEKNNIAASFRDPSGFVFLQNGVVYRQINKSYKNDYERFVGSGLLEILVQSGKLIAHRDVSVAKFAQTPDAWKVIQPDNIPFLSYPYEWCFSMLKDAALLTLHIQKLALSHNMSLKDASAFNIQFVEGKPVLIDTLSFEIYEEGKPWVAYKQFVEHFLAPLCLMAMVDIRLNRLTSLFLDGISVDVAASMLPIRSRFNVNLLIHIFAHAKSQKRFSNKKIDTATRSKKFSKGALLGLLDSLESAVKKLHWSPKGTQWADYYDEKNNNYIEASLDHKGKLVKKYLTLIKPKTVWDMGANTGHFSKIAVETGACVIAFDADCGAIEKNYRDVKNREEKHILPLFCDLTNPTPAVGWANEERTSLIQRASADAVLALALIHHIAISNNIPFDYIASCFAKLGKYLIIEYVDKEDSQVQILLANRKDIFTNYTQEYFEEAFSAYFTIKQKEVIKGSKRTLYLLEKK